MADKSHTIPSSSQNVSKARNDCAKNPCAGKTYNY